MIPRSNQHSVDTQAGDGLADLFNLFDIRVFENCGIGGDVITAAFTFFDHSDGFIKDAGAIANQIMSFTHAVQMDVDCLTLVGWNSAIDLGVK